MMKVIYFSSSITSIKYTKMYFFYVYKKGKKNLYLFIIYIKVFFSFSKKELILKLLTYVYSQWEEHFCIFFCLSLSISRRDSQNFYIYVEKF